MTNWISTATLPSYRAGVRALSIAVLLLAAFCLANATGARAALEFETATVDVDEPPLMNDQGTPFPQDDFPFLNPDGTFVQPLFSRQAGGHPDLSVRFSLPVTTEEGTGAAVPVEIPKDIDVDLPKGFVGNPTAMPTCSPLGLANSGSGGPDCPVAAQIGIAEINTVANGGQRIKAPVFNLAHGPDVPGRFGFNFSNVVGLITPRVNPGDYSISSGSFSISSAEAVNAVKVTIWGVPADPIHDSLRMKHGFNQISGPIGGPMPQFLWTSTDTARLPFLTAPASCSDDPVSFTMRGNSWEDPGAVDTRVLTSDSQGTPFAFEGCDRLPFDPTMQATTLSRAADAPTGLNVDIEVPQSEDPESVSTAHVRRIVTTLPKGMTVSASSAAGLGACSPAQIGLGTNDPPTCPDSSILGAVQIDTPLLDEQLEGDVILAKQNDNPFNSLLAMYIAVKGPGFYLKLPGRIDADPNTGQLTVTFDNTPQLPFEHVRLALPGGPQASLQTPNACGTYNARAEFVSWASDDTVVSEIPMTFDQGCDTGGFDPKLNAGSVSPRAGDFTPFNLQVVRADGETNLSRIQATLPEGLLAKLAGVPLCSDAQAAGGNCPASSQVGTTTVAAGPGTDPVVVPEAGKAPTAVYLAGPYKGAPYSMVVKVPAQAGPFDLGTVTVRNGLYIDPTTAQATAKSDALPQILQGIPIAYRDVRVEVNRPDFTVNPTNCDPKQVTSVLTSSTGQTATPADRFQVMGCGELGFGPSLKISLKGKMNRTGNPALSAVLKAPKGQANIAKTTVILPKSQFIDNAHINNPCTRVQFDAGNCPKGSILGTATAYTPLLDQPLTGPVYFRSNGGERELPDLVADLNGQIHVTLVGFIDSINERVRTRFQNVPDAPVSKFVLKMKGGAKGLIENSRDLCSFTPKAKVQMTGQNGKPNNFAAKIGTQCGGKKK